MLSVLGVSALLVVLAGVRPSYDGFGFLVWGHQVLHWNLNTDGAPSWKPLPFLFTLPYALAGHAQMWLWMGTSMAGAIASGVFAARVAYRLTGPCPDRRYAPFVAGAFAGLGVLGIATYSHLVLISNSDPLIVAALLAAIDCHLARRPRLAFTLLVLASLGRPEAWVFTGLYALWAWWRRVPGMRVLTVAGILLIPAFWFGVPALTSHSWFISGDLALNQSTVIHGNKIIGVIERLRSLYTLPMQIAVVCGVVLAAIRRDRVTLVIAAGAVIWEIVEVGFAYHGWSAVARYMIEAAAVLIVVAGYAVGRVLAGAPRRLPLRWTGLAAVAVLVVTLVPDARTQLDATRYQVHKGRVSAARINRLAAVIDQYGVHRIRSCGQPISHIGLQSTLAWHLDMNVGNVGFNPGKAIGRGKPVIYFNPHLMGWRVRPYNLRKATAAECSQLRTDTAFN